VSLRKRNEADRRGQHSKKMRKIDRKSNLNGSQICQRGKKKRIEESDLHCHKRLDAKRGKKGTRGGEGRGRDGIPKGLQLAETIKSKRGNEPYFLKGR